MDGNSLEFFVVEVHLPNSERKTYTWPKRATIDLAKGDVFKSTSSLADQKPEDWNLCCSEADVLEIEFVRLYAAPSVEAQVKQNKPIRLSLIPKRHGLEWKKRRKHTHPEQGESERVWSDSVGEIATREGNVSPAPKRRTRSLPNEKISCVAKKEKTNTNQSRVLTRTKRSGHLKAIVLSLDEEHDERDKFLSVSPIQIGRKDKQGRLERSQKPVMTRDGQGLFRSPEMWRYIFSFIDQKDHLAAVSLTCKAWHELAEHELLRCKQKMKLQKILNRQHGLQARALRGEGEGEISFYSRFPEGKLKQKHIDRKIKRRVDTVYTQIPPRLPSSDEPVPPSLLAKNPSWIASEDGWVFPADPKNKGKLKASCYQNEINPKNLEDENRRLGLKLAEMKAKLRDQKVKQAQQEKQVMEILTYFTNTLDQMASLKKLTQLPGDESDNSSAQAYRPTFRITRSVDEWDVLKSAVGEESRDPRRSREGERTTGGETRGSKHEKEKEKGKAKTRKRMKGKRGRSLSGWKKTKEPKGPTYEIEKKIVKGNTWEGNLDEVRRELARQTRSDGILPSSMSDPTPGCIPIIINSEIVVSHSSEGSREEITDRPSRDSSSFESSEEKEKEAMKDEIKSDSEIPEGQYITSDIPPRHYLISPENVRKICVATIEKGKDDLMKLTTEQQRQRYWILKKDFMDGEGKFVMNVLNVITKVYLRPLKLALKVGKPIIEEVDLHIIFGDFEPFYREHTEFYYECVHIWQKGDFLGHAIHEYGMRMVSYPFRFIENHHLASEHIKKLKTKNKVFKQWMEEVEFSDRSQFMDLISLLAKPVGRFAYYRVMLERFLSYVNPEERIYEPGMELQSQLTRLLSRLSAPTEKEDAQRFQMMDLQTQKKSGPFVDFLKPGRQLVHKGRVGIHDQETGKITIHYILLCNDLIVCGKILSWKKQEFLAKHVYSLHGADLVSDSAEGIKYSLILLTKEAPLVLALKSAEHKLKWETALRETLKTLAKPVRVVDQGSRTEYSLGTRPTLIRLANDPRANNN